MSACFRKRARPLTTSYLLCISISMFPLLALRFTSNASLTKVKGLRVEAIIRSGLRTFTDEAGHLWCSLADFFIRQAHFEQARDVYEEAISSVVTVRDFSMIFDAYTQFEESMISAKIEQHAANEGPLEVLP